jgi:tRNA(Ile)-lysidine synthase
MIQKRFRQKLEDLKGLINDDIWSASSGKYMIDPRGPEILLAVSGGMDSMCMASLFMETCGSSGIALAHCNFNLRNEESDGDETMVREWAAQWNLRLHVESFDTLSYAGEHGLSVEMAARELRYSWFAELCARYGYRYVAVAHHADDNAETLILNMTRGAGLRGMTGMKEISGLPYSGESSDVRLIRPMLEFTRKQIEGYVMRNRIPYRTDSSNMSVEYRRNRIRHEVMPVLQKLNPSLVSTLNREMSYIADASAIVEDWCRTAVGDVVISPADCSGACCGKDGRPLRISTPALLAHKQWRYLLYYILEPYGFNSSVLSSLENLITSGRTVSGKRFMSGTHELMTERDELVVVRLEDGQDEEGSLTVSEAGIYCFNGVDFLVEICPWRAGQSLKQPDGVQIFDAAKLKFPVVFRKWKTGDWMIPLGMRGKKKISDIFTDLKYDAAAKKAAVVLAGKADDMQDNAHVAAMLWVRMDSAYKVDEKTEMIIRIKRR